VVSMAIQIHVYNLIKFYCQKFFFCCFFRKCKTFTFCVMGQRRCRRRWENGSEGKLRI
jgi:hypothetical protein